MLDMIAAVYDGTEARNIKLRRRPLALQEFYFFLVIHYHLGKLLISTSLEAIISFTTQTNIQRFGVAKKTLLLFRNV